MNFKKDWYYFLFFLIVLNQVSWSQTITFNFQKTDNQISEISNTLKNYQYLLDNKKISTDSLDSYLVQLYADRDSILKTSISIQNSIQKSNNLLTTITSSVKLGIEEPENIANEQKKLSSQIGTLTGLLQKTTSLIANIDNVTSQISKLETSQFISNLSKRSTTQFSKKLWVSAFNDFKGVTQSIITYFIRSWENLWKGSDRFINIIILLISWIGAFLIYRAPRSDIGNKIKLYFSRKTPTNFLRKKMQEISKPLIYTFLTLLIGSILYWGLIETNLITSKEKPLIYRIWIGSAILVFIWHFAVTTFAPDKRYWFGLGITKGNAVKARIIFFLFFVVFIVDRIITSVFSIINGSINFFIAQAIITSLLFIILFILFFNKKLWQLNSKTETNETLKKSILNLENDHISVNKPLLLVEIILFLGKGFAFILLSFVFLGYIRLADFIFQRIMLFSIFILIFYTTRLFTFWGLEKLIETTLEDDKDDITYQNLIKDTKIEVNNSVDKKILINFWVKLSIDFSLILFSIPVFLYLIGFDWLQVEHTISFLLSGFTVGAITVSLKNVFTGVFIFILIIVLTKLLTSFLTKKFKKIEQVGSGVNNTIVTMISYFGILLAFLVALPVIGLSLSKVALIAGALSVGIGFGLKNIVNDFVSGLILIFERPIKIGDRVVVNSITGYVEKIQARATILKTYDMATIVVPNSELISQSFLNWFYKGKQGRFNLDVGVDYDSDPKLVEKLILQCADEHKLVLKNPEPLVVWLSYGDSSINFQLRAFVDNYDDARYVKSDLHYSIFDKLKEAGISIPFPQQDLNIKSPIQIVNEPETKASTENNSNKDNLDS